jgi:hypothetical protein
MVEALEIYYNHDQPTTCPKCGVRTHFEDLGNGQQKQTCLACSYQFLTEDEEPATDEELAEALKLVQSTQESFWDALQELEQLMWRTNPAVSLSSETPYEEWGIDQLKEMMLEEGDDEDADDEAHPDLPTAQP